MTETAVLKMCCNFCTEFQKAFLQYRYVKKYW